MNSESSFRRLVTLAVALLAASACAQVTHPPLDPNNPRLRAFKAVMGDADKVIRKARSLLNEGDDSGAEREADRYLLLIQALDSEDDRWSEGIWAKRILAEVYVRQGRFAPALEMSREDSKWGSGGVDAPLLAVRAVALARLNRLDEARAVLTRALPMGNVPVDLLGDPADLPFALGRSADALVATAWLVHAADTFSDSRYAPRTRKALETALRLAPGNPVVVLNAARFYRETAKRPDLARKALAGAVGGSAATRALLAREAASLPAETAKPAGA